MTLGGAACPSNRDTLRSHARSRAAALPTEPRNLTDDQPFAFAGLWERWGDDAEPIESCTIITTEPSAIVSDIHDRMPVILDASDHELWLDPEFENDDDLGSMLRPWLDERLVVEPVSTHVNNPRNDSPECVEVQ